MLFQLKACRRCKGDLVPGEDEEEWVCLQCGGRFFNQLKPIRSHYGRRLPIRPYEGNLGEDLENL